MTTQPYATTAPTRAEVDAMPGTTLIQFGTDWCGHCKAAEPLVNTVLKDYPNVRHLKIEDGSGRRPGRSFQVKLWPTLVFLKDGREVTRLIRPARPQEVAEAFNSIDPAA